VFGLTQKDGRIMQLMRHDSVKVRVITKVKAGCSIYDGDIKYWAGRMKQQAKSGLEKLLLIRQDYCCSACGLPFSLVDTKEPREIHHIVPKSKGGKHQIDNLTLVHGYCHDQIHNKSKN